MNMRRVISSTLFVAVALSVGLGLAERPPVDGTSCAERVYDRLFFGLGTAKGIVSDDDWTRFLREVITPRFADGLTVVDAHGQWRGAGDREVTVEPARVVEIAHDDSPEIDRAIGEVVAIYRRRHQQRSVMRTRGRLEVCL
jgi:hypothetical protein